jgi:prepilin-type N-terminal cleavage/methylation domain-containing protein
MSKKGFTLIELLAVIVILAIIALIATLGYLYFNNEQVRDAINALGQTFIEVGQIIYSAVLGFVYWVIQSLEGLYNYIMTFGGLLETNVSNKPPNVMI